MSCHFLKKQLYKPCYNSAVRVLGIPTALEPLWFVQVSEILDSELLGEGLIPTLQHAHDELLVKNPRTVPYRATTYGVVSTACFRFNTILVVLPKKNSFLTVKSMSTCWCLVS